MLDVGPKLLCSLFHSCEVKMNEKQQNDLVLFKMKHSVWNSLKIIDISVSLL